MQNIKIVYLNLIIISASIICFEIISTRISSVIFVSNYAFIILSLAILGLAAGGIYSYYKIKTEPENSFKLIFNLLLLSGSSLLLFIICVTVLKLTSSVIYFFLLFLPMFFFGIIFAQIFKNFASYSFTLYASDLLGAALGSIAPIFIIDLLGAPNSILLLAVLIFGLAGIYLVYYSSRKKITLFYSIVTAALLLLVINGNNNLLGKVPIGKFDEKDFYYVYPNAENISEIIESRWSIYGRSDLVEYSNQNMVKQLFVDGAAGSQMYRFDGNVKSPDQLLYNLLINHSNTIPFFFLTEREKNNMLVIGPGGGKEILTGLVGNVEQITGVEVNPDFVNIVKDYSDFNGGIYTNFPNVKIEIAEGRHFIKKTDIRYDLIVMALPSTKQMQNIEGMAENETYLLTVEALKDYLKTLTDEGSLIFTVHNQWELMRLIVTAISAFKETNDTSINDIVNHFAVIETEYNPTVIIRKNAFTRNEAVNWQNINNTIPQGLPFVTYLPFSTNPNSVVNNFFSGLIENKFTLDEYIKNFKYDISPCSDDSPYFYKINKGVPEDFTFLTLGVFIFNLLAVGIPYMRTKKKFVKDKTKKDKIRNIRFFLAIFMSMGIGFMILEISLFQKLILFLGSPTISLSILLSSLLIGMGTGSYLGGRIKTESSLKRLSLTGFLIVLAGILFFIVYPLILHELLQYSLFFRAAASFILILPLGILLGIPFPTAIKLLKMEANEDLIPWMYGVNGTMSVLGSILAVILSMLSGFTAAFFIGICFYLILAVIAGIKNKSIRTS
ncbi:MAG: hypothetical protein R6W90_13540 [Ignavibacteriaceae bacterium]